MSINEKIKACLLSPIPWYSYHYNDVATVQIQCNEITKRAQEFHDVTGLGNTYTILQRSVNKDGFKIYIQTNNLELMNLMRRKDNFQPSMVPIENEIPELGFLWSADYIK